METTPRRTISIIERDALARGIVPVKLLRTTPQERVFPKGKLKETFVTAMGKTSVRPAFDSFIRSGPDAASIVMTMAMMVLTALLMPVMAVLVMAMTGDHATNHAAQTQRNAA